ncbi:uncharacterized protein BJ171DRAFT_515984 [Polychytrium aggregatum]|uniref:uncharacterized protein n=1 Tax=Polychytrium aggregatum TaxID=110093 RepID=UPI0022FEA72A|nr:uncharacterized protein BJ171DRAFT_515984 [Polychytrium aggregatum]KAI9201939.1 hypothetical protein BJ171DRAFT_515984 [Polychytrium aggregatum]
MRSTAGASDSKPRAQHPTLLAPGRIPVQEALFRHRGPSAAPVSPDLSTRCRQQPRPMITTLPIELVDAVCLRLRSDIDKLNYAVALRYNGLQQALVSDKPSRMAADKLAESDHRVFGKVYLAVLQAHESIDFRQLVQRFRPESENQAALPLQPQFDFFVKLYTFQGLRFHESLTTIDLSDTNLNSTMPTFAKCLGHNRTLIRIDLNSNRIDDTGAVLLAQAMQAHPRLSQVNLKYNYIEDEGAIALAGALTHMKRDVRLDLEYNLIGDLGAEALSKALLDNDMVEASLRVNRISEIGLRLLTRALRHHHHRQKDLPPLTPQWTALQSVPSRQSPISTCTL